MFRGMAWVHHTFFLEFVNHSGIIQYIHKSTWMNNWKHLGGP